MGEDGGFSHLDAKGRARMVDVGDKDETRRRAVARRNLCSREFSMTVYCSTCVHCKPKTSKRLLTW